MPSRVFSLLRWFAPSELAAVWRKALLIGLRLARAPPGTFHSMWEDRASVFPNDSLVHWEATDEGIYHETAGGPQVTLECLKTLAGLGPSTMPSADFCAAVRSPCGLLSRTRTQALAQTRHRPPEVSLTVFHAQPPDLQPWPLMDVDFADSCQLVRPTLPRIRLLFVGSRFRSTLPSDPASRRRPCASLSFTSIRLERGLPPRKLSNMLGTHEKSPAPLQEPGLFRFRFCEHRQIMRRGRIQFRQGRFRNPSPLQLSTLFTANRWRVPRVPSVRLFPA
jgi:hypothetical protein